MSKQLINRYYNELDKDKRFGGSHNEASIRRAFLNLVNSYAERRNLLLVPEIYVKGKKGNSVRPDGVLKNATRFEFGYWESKDTKDDIDFEINKKLNEDGYPDSNIIFEDTNEAVLFQEGELVQRVSMKDTNALDSILTRFINYEPSIVKEFSKALDKFKEDVPAIVEDLRELIERQAETNESFRNKRDFFYELARNEINPEITLEDVREMLIQHILTEDIFNNVFGNANFHKFNNIARELVAVLDTFMDYSVRQNHLQSIKSYYDTIRDASAGLTDHHEKQKFLKNIYENFYKVYNPKGADRLGVVYTPNEIVKFMIESTDFLLHKHFGKTLDDKNVDILDPATGTGTFIAELIEHIPAQYLEYKYKNELHANEVAILPYYIANLNIEYTYQQKMEAYAEFRNICFVDTLDNTDALHYQDKQDLLFGISSENAKRIKDQNAKKISVIIGNPPYNAKQPNYNFQNANRAYREIDKRIKDTYIKNGTAQNQSFVYDPFVKFYRWSSDRIDKNGIIAFVSNGTFIDSQSFDGFRKVVGEEFNEAWIINLKGNARTSGERRRQEAGNIFDDQIRVGIAVYFFIKNEKQTGFKIYYNEIGDYVKSEQKKEYLRENHISQIKFERIEPDAKNNWINQTDNDWDSLLPLIDKNVKAGKSEKAVFKLFSSGLKTQRDDWVYDFSKDALEAKMRYFVDVYETTRKDEHFADKMKIKWDRELDKYRNRNIQKEFSEKQIQKSLYRPYVSQYLYFDRNFIGMNYQWNEIYNVNESLNQYIAFTALGGSKDFHAVATSNIVDLHLTGDSQTLPFCVYSENQKHENITDWGLTQFQNYYGDRSEPPALAGGADSTHEKTPSAHADGSDKTNGKRIAKQDIFYYTYAVLHSPVYRKKYEQNLKREFPRLPLYDDFTQWRDWGKELMDLHINYETQKPFALGRNDLDLTPKKKIKQNDLFTDTAKTGDEPFIAKPKTKLRADKINGAIEIDSHTTLTGIPPLAWEYKLGNRSALEWILDQYKEKKPQDATIAERFNTYKFEDYKESVIDLLKRVTNVSVKTMEIVNQMP
ncbi:MAG: N-6 DNA methylase, partial [Pyrinomonadaceae bacterium]|nr:N-6 DNA methylase [Pyrinomonadaceae bacterium]